MRQLTKTHYIALVIFLFVYVLFGLTVKFPLLAPESQQETLFQSTSIAGILFQMIIISLLFLGVGYFVSFESLLKRIKVYKEPVRYTLNRKFEFWLRSELYEAEEKDQIHITRMAEYFNIRDNNRLDVLKKAAELNDMKVETFIKALRNHAQSSVDYAKSEVDLAKANLLNDAVKYIEKMPPMWQAYVISSLMGETNGFKEDLEFQRDLSDIMKRMKKEELRNIKLDNDYKKDKYDRVKKERKV
jgi:hypothetical protein